MALFENDLLVVVRLAFPSAKTVIVLDPAKTVIRNFECGFTYIYTRDQVLAVGKEKRMFILVNVSGATSFTFPFNFSNIEGIISFNTGYETSLDYFHFEFFYVVDQKDTLRWIISDKHKNTAFLLDYHQHQFVTDISNFITNFSSLSNYLYVKFGKINKVTDGNFQVLKREKNFLNCVENEKYDSFIIQLNAPAIQGLIRINVYTQNKCSAVINHSILPSGLKKIENEKMVLSEISRSEFDHFATPDFNTSDFSVCYFLSPILKSTDHKQTRTLIKNKLIEAINEYQNPYCREITLKELWNGNDVLKILTLIRTRISQNQLPRGLSATNLARLYAKIINIFNELDLNQSINVSLNNHSFNEENIYSANQKLYFTSWLNADFDLPLFSDLFYKEIGFVDGPGNPDADTLIKNINILINNSKLKEIAANYKADIKLYLKLYLILTCTTQLQTIVLKKIVLPEVNVHVFNWLSIAENICRNFD